MEEKPKWYWRFFPPISKEEAEAEIFNMRAIYKKHYPYGPVGFMVAPENTLCGNYSQGDSARFWELKRIINFWSPNK